MALTFGAPGEEQPLSGFYDPGAGVNVRAPTGPTLVNNAGVPILAGPADPSWMAASQPLVQALQDASKSSVFNPKEPPALGAATPREAAPGRPMQRLSLDALVQLLEKQRAQYGAMTGQPVARSQVLGLLGF